MEKQPNIQTPGARLASIEADVATKINLSSELAAKSELTTKAMNERSVSAEVQALNDKAEIEVFGSRGRTILDPETGTVIADASNPIPGVIEDIKHNPMFGTKEADRDAASKAYEADLFTLIDDEGLELCQAKLIMDSRRDSEASQTSYLAKLLSTGVSPVDAQLKTEKVYENLDKKRIDIIKTGGAYTAEDYKKLRSGKDLYSETDAPAPKPTPEPAPAPKPTPEPAPAPKPTPKAKAKRGVRFDKLGNAIVVVEGDSEPDVENTKRMIEVSKNSGKVALLSFLGRERIERLNGQELTRNQAEWDKTREKIDPKKAEYLLNGLLGAGVPHDKLKKLDKEYFYKDGVDGAKDFMVESESSQSPTEDKTEVIYDATEIHGITNSMREVYKNLSDEEKADKGEDLRKSLEYGVRNLLEVGVLPIQIQRELKNKPTFFTDLDQTGAIDSMSDDLRAWFDANPDAKAKYLELIGADDSDDDTAAAV